MPIDIYILFKKSAEQFSDDNNNIAKATFRAICGNILVLSNESKILGTFKNLN